MSPPPILSIPQPLRQTNGSLRQRRWPVVATKPTFSSRFPRFCHRCWLSPQVLDPGFHGFSSTVRPPTSRFCQHKSGPCERSWLGQTGGKLTPYPILGSLSAVVTPSMPAKILANLPALESSGLNRLNCRGGRPASIPSRVSGNANSGGGQPEYSG